MIEPALLPSIGPLALHAFEPLPLHSFPSETVPDGEFFAPHHFLYPLYAVALVWLLAMNDESGWAGALVLVGVAVALVGWFHFWPFYPVFGTLLALAGVLFVILGGAAERRAPGHWRATVVLLGVVSLDDWIDHAFDVDTPLSLVFDLYVVQYMT